ncbi:MAG: hypothetical protein AAB599_03815 [Patescibacteria group bacterium]
MATKYKKMVDEMLTTEKSLFDEFREVHNRYFLNPKQTQDEFNEKGRKVQEVIRKYENILCGRSENTGYGAYSSSLAQKFQDEIRKIFPKIDFIGVKISDPFSDNLKRIKV